MRARGSAGMLNMRVGFFKRVFRYLDTNYSANRPDDCNPAGGEIAGETKNIHDQAVVGLGWNWVLHGWEYGIKGWPRHVHQRYIMTTLSCDKIFPAVFRLNHKSSIQHCQRSLLGAGLGSVGYYSYTLWEKAQILGLKFGNTDADFWEKYLWEGVLVFNIQIAQKFSYVNWIFVNHSLGGFVRTLFKSEKLSEFPTEGTLSGITSKSNGLSGAAIKMNSAEVLS